MPDPTITQAGMRIIKLLVGNRPQSVADLIKAAGVTRTAVTEQLNELVAAGLVERGIERLPGRGRPRHLYQATDTAMQLLFAGNQRLVVPAIWRAVRELGGEKLLREVVRRVTRSLADHYNRRITARRPRDRLRQLIELLRREGNLIEVVREGGRTVVRKRSCPFLSMLDENRSICTVDLDVMSAVVGRPVIRTACRHEGAPCCTFQIANGRQGAREPSVGTATVRAQPAGQRCR